MVGFFKTIVGLERHCRILGVDGGFYLFFVFNIIDVSRIPQNEKSYSHEQKWFKWLNGVYK